MRAVACLFACLFAGCAAIRAPAPVQDDDVRALMARERVTGLALAVIDRGQIVQVRAYGRRDAARNLPLTTETVMYGASLTKPAFAYMLLQLADEGRLGLDTPLPALLPQPLTAYGQRPYDYTDLAGDDRWRRLTPRILLLHAAGFANFKWVEPDRKLRFHFEPGSRYAYSGEGFNVLQLVVERGLGLDTDAEMRRRIFDRFGMRRTSMRWRDDFADDVADTYDETGTLHPHERRRRASAAGSMDTTIEDQARLWAAIVRGDGLSPEARMAFARPQLPIGSSRQFPTLTAPAASWPQALSAGLGVVTFRDRSGPAWFKAGHDAGTANMVVCMETRRRCVVLLSNDVRAEHVYPAIVRSVLGENDMPWGWEYAWYR